MKHDENFKNIISSVHFFLMIFCLLFLTACGIKDEESIRIYREKASLLKESALVEQSQAQEDLSSKTNTVFISVCDTTKRARVFTGTGSTLDNAWANASKKAEKCVGAGDLEPVWIKADVVSLSQTMSAQELHNSLKNSLPGYFRYGVAFDHKWENALLEAELNGTKSFDYENGTIDLKYLNHYLEETERKEITELPDEYTIFQCNGWLCDEKNTVYQLSGSGPDYGLRNIEKVDDAYVREMILNSSKFLANQVRGDGSFAYGIYPRFDKEIDHYNIIRHASSIWALICRYRLEPDAKLEKTIQQAINYMLDQVVYDDKGNAYLYEKESDEIKLGGCGVAVIALTEYMDVFNDNKYMSVCKALGRGIISLLDQKTGEYYHVLNRDFSQKEAFRTTYYDGEATFALCRLYGLTEEKEWILAAKNAVDHFVLADYTQYKDHWIAFAMNEITKYIKNDKDYYIFALKNAQVSLNEISRQDTSCHTCLELLMSAFEVYDRMIESGISIEGFDLELLLKTIYTQANYMRTGYFYPEYAMYMENPRRILNTFMVRHDGYRVRIDDIRHNIGGYYLYYTNYDKLIKYGMM